MPPATVATIPPDVIEFYSALGQYDNRLEGLLLSDYGLYVKNDNVRLAEVEDGHTDAKYKRVQVGITMLDEVPTLYLAICRQCNDVIHRDNSHAKRNKTGNTIINPPENAIANGNWIGILPERFKGLTRTDESSISLMVPCLHLSTVVSGHETLDSHHFIVKNPNPVIEEVPRNLHAIHRLTLVGPMTSEVQAAQRKRFPWQHSLCKEFLNFLKLKNKLYIQHDNNINMGSFNNQAQFNETDFNESLVVDRTDTGGNAVNPKLVRIMLFGITNHNEGKITNTSAPAATSNANVTQEEQCRSKFVFQPETESNESAKPTDVIAFNSSNTVYNKNFALCPYFYPTLLPYGCGGPAEERLVPLTAKKWILRSLRLNCRSGIGFQNHHSFLPMGFDAISTKEAYASQFVAMRIKKNAIKTGLWKKEEILQCETYAKLADTCLKTGQKVNNYIFFQLYSLHWFNLL